MRRVKNVLVYFVRIYERARAGFVYDKSKIPIVQMMSEASRKKMRSVDWAMFLLNDFPGLVGLVVVLVIIFVILYREVA